MRTKFARPAEMRIVPPERSQGRVKESDALDSLEFILIIAVFAAILGWYLFHAMRGETDGRLGLFALKPDPEAEKPSGEDASPETAAPRYRSRGKKKRYRLKSRATGRRTLRDKQAG